MVAFKSVLVEHLGISSSLASTNADWVSGFSPTPASIKCGVGLGTDTHHHTLPLHRGSFFAPSIDPQHWILKVLKQISLTCHKIWFNNIQLSGLYCSLGVLWSHRLQTVSVCPENLYVSSPAASVGRWSALWLCLCCTFCTRGAQAWVFSTVFCRVLCVVARASRWAVLLMWLRSLLSV